MVFQKLVPLNLTISEHDETSMNHHEETTSIVFTYNTLMHAMIKILCLPITVDPYDKLESACCGLFFLRSSQSPLDIITVKFIHIGWIWILQINIINS